MKTTLQRGIPNLEEVKVKLAMHPAGAPEIGTGNDVELNQGWCVTWLMLINQFEIIDNIT